MRRLFRLSRVWVLLLAVGGTGLGLPGEPSPPVAHAQAVIRVAGLWVGTWQSTRSLQFGALSMKLQQAGSAVTGTVVLTDAAMCAPEGRATGQITDGAISDAIATTGRLSAGHCTLRFEGKVMWQPSGATWIGTYSAGASDSPDEGTFSLGTTGTSTF